MTADFLLEVGVWYKWFCCQRHEVFARDTSLFQESALESLLFMMRSNLFEAEPTLFPAGTAVST